MVEQFSFYVRFPGKAPISALCLDHYVTDQRPIICLGSQDGDIAIYYLDKLNPETGKVEPEKKPLKEGKTLSKSNKKKEKKKKTKSVSGKKGETAKDKKAKEESEPKPGK